MTVHYLERGEDYASWGVVPTYQVEFWTHLADRRPDIPPEKVGYKKDAYLVSEAKDIDEVMSWAREQAQGRIVVVYAVVPGGSREGRGLLHLSGNDPTVPSSPTQV